VDASTKSDYHVYEVRPRKDKRGVDLISDVLPFGRLWYGDANAVTNAVGYATHYSRSHHAVIRVFDAAGDVIASDWWRPADSDHSLSTPYVYSTSGVSLRVTEIVENCSVYRLRG
jgi:hypothetical protein